MLNLNRRRPKGNALLTALFIMALIAIAATAMVKQLNTSILRTERFIQTDKLYLSAQFIQLWAISTLKETDLSLIALNKEGLVLSLPAKLQNQYPGYQLSGSLYDLQSKLNLNGLTDPNIQSIFVKLAQQQEPSQSTAFIRSLTAAIIDWISPQSTLNQDKWSQYYSSLPQPYLPAHQPMQSIYELNMVAGITPDLFQKLLPYVCVLPQMTPININTASSTLMHALSTKENNPAIDAFLAQRTGKEIKTQEEFNEIVKKLNVNSTTVSYQSNYFLAVAVVTQGQHKLTLYTVLKRTKNKTTPAQPSSNWNVSLVRQSINTL
jgi:general secretion pathway protein K